MLDNFNRDPKELLEDNYSSNDDDDKHHVYTEEQRNKDILITKFQNIARYIDTELHDDGGTMAIGNVADMIIDDYDLMKLNEERFNFYMELQKIIRKDPRILKIIMNLNNRIKMRKKKEKRLLNQLTRTLKNIGKKNIKGDDGGGEDGGGGKGDKEEIINRLQNVLIKNYNPGDKPGDTESQNDGFKAIDLYKYLINKQSGGSAEEIMNKVKKELDEKDTGSTTAKTEDKIDRKDIIEKGHKLAKYISKEGKGMQEEDKLRGSLALEYGMNNLENLTENILKLKNTNADKFERKKNGIEDFIDDYYKAHSKSNKGEVSKSLQKALDKFEASPSNFLDNIKITREDRLIFIFVTFFIRYVTVLMVQWCVDIQIIKDFYQGFLLYAVIYIIIFWFMVMLVNINNISPTSYMNTDTNLGSLQSMFYYFYMGTNGVSRLLTHSFLIVMLLAIPIILNIQEKKSDDPDEIVDTLSYEDKKKLVKTLSLFTIFIWVLTSMIAIKY
jgi:hypothetical protein